MTLHFNKSDGLHLQLTRNRTFSIQTIPWRVLCFPLKLCNSGLHHQHFSQHFYLPRSHNISLSSEDSIGFFLAQRSKIFHYAPPKTTCLGVLVWFPVVERFNLYLSHSSSLKEVKAGTQKQEPGARNWGKRSWRNAVNWLLNLLFYIFQDQLLRGGTTYSDLGPPTSAINQDNVPHRQAYGSIWWWTIPLPRRL